MPKKTNPKSPLPEYIQNSRLLSRRKVTKAKLPSFAEAMMLLHTPEALRLFWESTITALKAGDKDARKFIAEAYDYVKTPGGINISQQILQNNVAAGSEAPVKGFDAFVRDLAEKRAGHPLPVPTILEHQPAEEFRPAEIQPASHANAD